MLGDTILPLLRGTVVTVEVFVLAASLATVMAVAAGTARRSPYRAVRWTATVFVEVFRGTSALVLLYIAYFVLPMFGLALAPLAAGVLAIGLNSGAYGAEIVRGALQAVPKGQTEAATALGMGPWKRFRHVTLPAAMVLILPPAGNQLIDLLKLTALVSLVTLADITFEGQALRLADGQTFQVYALMLVFYFVLSSAILALVGRLEHRARRGVDVARRA